MSIQILAVLSRSLSLKVEVPPYEASAGFNVEAKLDNAWRPSATRPGHVSFTQKAAVRGVGVDGTPYFEAVSELELLVAFAAEDEGSLEDFATHHLAEIAFPFSRQKVGSLITQAGYQMGLLPAIGNASFKPALRLEELA